MNIQQATEQIKGAICAYLASDKNGLACIPFHMQRPLIMFGPPGVGKTAIVSQVAQEVGINFVSYSITHHTRQSAIGLPLIKEEVFGGKTYSVSEYTMSEIIAACYRAQQKTGVNQGILFLDEINCVSETLAPALLQFLQYKTFGMHELPHGWIIVCAGNPPEYNRAAREFDPALLDRLKRIDVEPSLEVWQEYAARHGIHPAITTFLESKPQRFYKVQAAAAGTQLVTPRGWEDLSRMIQTYEQEHINVNELLCKQYLQDETIALEFSCYYDLFRKYQDDYKIEHILQKTDTNTAKERLAQAAFDERLAFVGLLTSALQQHVAPVIYQEQALRFVRNDLLKIQEDALCCSRENALALLHTALQTCTEASDIDDMFTHENINGDIPTIRAYYTRLLRTLISSTQQLPAENTSTHANCFDAIKTLFNEYVAQQRAQAVCVCTAINNAFAFLDDALGASSQECLVLTTKLSLDPLFVRFVSTYGSDSFISHNKNMLLGDRTVQLLADVEKLDLSDLSGE